MEEERFEKEGGLEEEGFEEEGGLEEERGSLEDGGEVGKEWLMISTSLVSGELE